MITVINKVKNWFGRPLSCEDVNGFIVEYLEGTLPARPRRLFEAHVAMCPACGPYLEQYRRTIEMVRETGAELPEPPSELVEATLTFLREHLDDF